MKTKNEAKGKVWYGMHFYPGVAEYQYPDGPARVFLSEDTIRDMDPTFSGRPVFILHVNEVAKDIDVLKHDADGWVSESFYNSADGKHWVKFITVSEDADSAIANGWKLSNCYIQQQSGPGGMWNGVTYEKEITKAEYEHLAIVPNPRYEESVIMTPEQFKKYNEDKLNELKRLANDKQGVTGMFKFFKKTKLENSLDIESMSVVLPKSGREVSITKLINEADALEADKGKPRKVNADDMVEVDKEEMSVGDLITKLKDACSALEAMKASNEDDGVDDRAEEDEDTMANEEDDAKEAKEAKEDKDAKEKNKNAADAKAKADADKLAADKAAAKEKDLKLRNAHLDANKPVTLELSFDRVARGKKLMGSGK